MGLENKLLPDYAITASSEVGLTILVIFLLPLDIRRISTFGWIDVY